MGFMFHIARGTLQGCYRITARNGIPVFGARLGEIFQLYSHHNITFCSALGSRVFGLYSVTVISSLMRAPITVILSYDV